MQGWNARNPAVKRILQELRECQQDDNLDIKATAAEDNLFEWRFVMRGPWESEFEGGIYHGRILLPAEYPFKPPSFVMATPSGRWETGTKICLSISSHHPESWQPSWTVRAALVALRVFMQTPAAGAVGAMDSPPDVRRALAAESHVFIPRASEKVVQEQIEALHKTMLETEAASRALHDAHAKKEAAQTGENTTGPPASPSVGQEPTTDAEQGQAQPLLEADAAPPAGPSPLTQESKSTAVASISNSEGDVRPPLLSEQAGSVSLPASIPQQVTNAPDRQEVLDQRTMSNRPGSATMTRSARKEERGLAYLALVLVVVILAILVRRVVLVTHMESPSEDVYYSLHRRPVSLDL